MAMLALLATLYFHIFAFSFFIYTLQCQIRYQLVQEDYISRVQIPLDSHSFLLEVGNISNLVLRRNCENLNCDHKKLSNGYGKKHIKDFY